MVFFISPCFWQYVKYAGIKTQSFRYTACNPGRSMIYKMSDKLVVVL